MANSERPLTPPPGGGGPDPRASAVAAAPPPLAPPLLGAPVPLSPILEVIQDAHRLSLDAPVSHWYGVAIALSLGLADLGAHLPGEAGATREFGGPVLRAICATLHQRHPALRPHLERLTRDAGVAWEPAP